MGYGEIALLFFEWRKSVLS